MRVFSILLLLFLLCAGKVYSQNDVMRFTDYEVAQPIINPAAAGLEPGVGGVMLYRSRFEKSEYWPSTGAFNLNTMFEDKNIGGGVTLIFDKYGPKQHLLAYLAGVYRLQVDEGKYLHFGLQAGINYVSNKNEYDPIHPEETIFSESYSQPNFGFGLHYRSEKFYMGVSIPELKYNTIDQEGNKISNTMSDRLRVYLYGGYKVKLSESATLTPLAYLYYSEEEDTQLDIGAKVNLKDNFEFGARYRTKESFGIIARVRLLEQLWLGYAFESNNSDIDNKFNSVQEISLTFRFGKGATKTASESKELYEDINSIRYF